MSSSRQFITSSDSNNASNEGHPSSSSGIQFKIKTNVLHVEHSDICRQYLLGTCNWDSCNYKHVTTTNQRPTKHCYYVFSANCIRENCGYAHVEVGPPPKSSFQEDYSDNLNGVFPVQPIKRKFPETFPKPSPKVPKRRKNVKNPLTVDVPKSYFWTKSNLHKSDQQSNATGTINF